MRRLSALVAASAALVAGCSSCGASPTKTDEDSGAAPIPSFREAGDGGPVSAEMIPKGKVVAMVNPNKLPPYSGAVGSVAGHVYVAGDPPEDSDPKGLDGCPTARETFGKAFREADAGANPNAKGGRALADAVVVATGYTDVYLPETREALSLKVEGCSFGARTFTMTYGQRIEVQNLTKDLIAPDLAQAQGPAMFLAAPFADPVKIYPPRPGRYDLISRRAAPWLHADVYVLLHPLHTTTKVDGAYRLDGIPVGTRKISVMHPGASGVAIADVEVKVGAIAAVDLVIENKSKPKSAPVPLVDDAGKPRPVPH